MTTKSLDDGHILARRKPCPTCKAREGKVCVRPSGHRVFGGRSHASRWRAAGLGEMPAAKPTGEGRIPDNVLVFEDADLARERFERLMQAPAQTCLPEPLPYPDEVPVEARGAPPAPLYATRLGQLYCGDSLDVMPHLEPECAQLVFTSPPYALVRKKEYGNEDADQFVSWFLPFVHRIKRLLKPGGYFVLNLGPAWKKGSATVSTYDIETMLSISDHLHPLHEIIWHKVATMPGPAQWVTVEKIRVTMATERIWIFSKDPYAFDKLPPEVELDAVLRLANKASNTDYDRACRAEGIRQHPARFPPQLARYFIERLTRPGDLVVDPFAGSNTTGSVAEEMERRWAGIELDDAYARASQLRFPATAPAPRARTRTARGRGASWPKGRYCKN